MATNDEPFKVLADAANELDLASATMVDGLQGHADNIGSIYRAVCSCIDAHEAGHDEIAWSTIRKVMEVTKTLELELLAQITEMRQA